MAGVHRAGKTFLCRSLDDVEYFDCELPRTRRLMEDPEGREGLARGFWALFSIYSREFRYTRQVPSAHSHRRKTSFEIDTAKVEAAKQVLGTRTLTDTIDAALSEVVKLRQRKTLVELLFRPGALDLDDPEVMSGAWR